MSGRRHKILNLLIESSNLIIVKICFKAYWHWTCIQNKLAYKVSSILSYLFVSRCKKTKMFQGFYPPEPRPRLQHEPAEELTALHDPHLHFTTFENSIFVKKWTLVKLLARSNVNEVIRVVFFCFFFTKRFYPYKKHKKDKKHK